MLKRLAILMDIFLYSSLSLIIPIFVLLGIIVIKMFAGHKLPDNHYTPFDQIMGQTSIEFHEQKVEQENEDGHGDDKNKNKIKNKITR